MSCSSTRTENSSTVYNYVETPPLNCSIDDLSCGFGVAEIDRNSSCLAVIRLNRSHSVVQSTLVTFRDNNPRSLLV